MNRHLASLGDFASLRELLFRFPTTMVSGMRVAARSMRFLAFIFGAIVRRASAIVFLKSARSRRAAAEWLQRTAEGCRQILALKPRIFGPLPSRGLLVA